MVRFTPSCFSSPEYTQKRVYGLPHESIVVGESKNIFFGKFTVFSMQPVVIYVVFFAGQFPEQFCPRGKDALRFTATRETRPHHNTVNYVSYSFR